MQIDKLKVDELLEIFNTKIESEYLYNTSGYNLNSLLEFYKELVPDWKEIYNEFNKRVNTSKEDDSFDELLGAQLSEATSIGDFKVNENSKIGKNSRQLLIDDIMQRARVVHLVNKIAHFFERIFKTRLKEYINNTETLSGIKNIEQIHALMKKVYSPTLDKSKKNVAIEELKKIGFTDEDFEKGKNLNKYNFTQLIMGFINAMKIKDMEIENIHLLVQQNKIKEISYGYKEDERQGRGALFVIDVFHFGQFSVHIKSTDLIEQLKTSPYQMPVYSIKTDLLVDYKSEQAREFYENAIRNTDADKKLGITDRTIDKERRRLIEKIRDLDMPKGKKHELAVRFGLGRKQLKKIDAEREGR